LEGVYDAQREGEKGGLKVREKVKRVMETRMVGSKYLNTATRQGKGKKENKKNRRWRRRRDIPYGRRKKSQKKKKNRGEEINIKKEKTSSKKRIIDLQTPPIFKNLAG